MFTKQSVLLPLMVKGRSCSAEWLATESWTSVRHGVDHVIDADADSQV
jgi:hypothetical protein